MQKRKNYKQVRFDVETIKNAYAELIKIAHSKEIEISCSILSIEHDDCSWEYDTSEEFFSDYRKYKNEASFRFWGRDISLHVLAYSSYTTIKISCNDRISIERIFEVFESNKDRCFDAKAISKLSPTVFIGHGGASHWKELKEHLQDKHNIKIEAYETGARAGHTIRDILEDMSNKSNIAFLVMSAEDKQYDNSLRTRQNVIHEIGLFQGKLGFKRAIILKEDGAEEFSNIDGVQQIRYSNIAETFGEVIATINREFPAT